jgi:hypothetical protein
MLFDKIPIIFAEKWSKSPAIVIIITLTPGDFLKDGCPDREA